MEERGVLWKYQISMLAWCQGFWSVFQIMYTINIRTFYFNSYSEGEGHLKTPVMISCSLFIVMHTICIP